MYITNEHNYLASRRQHELPGHPEMPRERRMGSVGLGMLGVYNVSVFAALGEAVAGNALGAAAAVGMAATGIVTSVTAFAIEDRMIERRSAQDLHIVE